MMNAILGEHIKNLRNANKLTQEFVAEKIGISRQKYARIERGENSITLEILSRIATIFDITVGDITKVLDEVPMVAYRTGDAVGSSDTIFEMLDLFYANKNLYKKITGFEE